MSAGKSDKWRKTDFKSYFNAPFWEKQKIKKTLETSKDAAIMSGDAKDKKVKQQ